MASTFYIPCEVFRREFSCKSVLSTFLSLHGAQVVFGHKWYVNQLAIRHAVEGDFYLSNHTEQSGSSEFLRNLKAKKVFLLGYEDEGVFSEENYKQQIISRKQLKKFDLFDRWLCWGKRDYEILVKENEDNKKFLNFGTPRSALWNELGRKLYSNSVLEEITPKYGKFILIASSFMSKTSNFNVRAILNLNKLNTEFDPADLASYATQEYYLSEEQKFNRLNNLIESVLRNTNLNIVLRPYHIKDKYFEKRLQKLDPKRIFIDERISITPLVIACEALVHMGSTVAIESLQFRKKTISIEEYLANNNSTPLLSTSLSYIVKNESDFISQICKSHKINNKVYENFVLSDSTEFYSKLKIEILNMNAAAFSGNYKSLEKPNLNIGGLIYRIATMLRRGSIYRYDLIKRQNIDLNWFKKFVNSTLVAFGFDANSLEIIKTNRATFCLRYKKATKM